MSANSSVVTTTIGMNCITMTFSTDVYAPKRDLLVSGMEDKIAERDLDVEFDVSSLAYGILTIVVGAASAVGYAVVELIDYIIKRIKASRY